MEHFGEICYRRRNTSVINYVFQYLLYKAARDTKETEGHNRDSDCGSVNNHLYEM